MTQARSVTATFNQITHNLAVTISGTGTVTGTGINCPGDCSETFAQGTNVSLTATPGANHTFAGWSGACTGTGACVVSITTTQSVGASFTQQMVFVYYIYTTNTIHTGNLGGRTGADNICNLSINRPPVCSRGWAFMSFSATDEIRDFPENAQTLSGLPLNQSAIWRSQTGTHSGVQIAGNWWDLTDGTIATPLVNGGAAAWYWTGTTSVFTQHNTCTGWITDQATLAGVVGDGSQAWNPWIFSGSPTCNNAHHVLCACF